MITKFPKHKCYVTWVVVCIIISLTVYMQSSVSEVDVCVSCSYAETLLALTRSQVALEMCEYRLPRPGVSKLAELVPAAGGTPLRVVVVSTWRSGSSFLGHLLSSTPASLYFYEPLKSITHTIQIRDLTNPKASTALTLLKNIMNIHLENNISRKYFQWLRNNSHTVDAMWHRSRFWDECRRHLCFDTEFLSKFYKLFPIQVFKLDRLRMAVAEQLLLDQGLNVKLVLLVRDPRGVLHSRLQNAHFTRDGARDPAAVCGDMARDHRAAHTLMRTFPGRLMVLRFEDLALNLDSSAEQLFQFLQLELTPAVHKFIQTHTNVSKDHAPYSTYRNTKQVPFQWRKGLNSSVVRDIEAQCEEAMSLWGYERVTQGQPPNTIY